jgi:hypothetical protein
MKGVKKMKLLFSLILLLNLIFVTGDQVDASENVDIRTTLSLKQNYYEEEFVFDVKEIQNYEYHLNEYSIYANYNSFDGELLKTIISDADKIIIFYDIDISNNVNKNYEILRNNAVIYYYINGIASINSFKSKATEKNVLVEEIEDFVNEKLINIKDKKQNQNTNVNAKSQPDTSSFEVLYEGSFREEGKPYGYIDCDYTVYKYRANNTSSLYLIDSRISFTPGSVANALGSTKYESKWDNYEGFVKLKAIPAENEVGYDQIRYGGTPVYKDAYPVSKPGKIAITSSFSIGANLGYSFTNGFSLDNISVEQETSKGLNILIGYSKTYENDEPALNTAKDPDDVQKYTWRYTYVKERSQSFNLNFGYMFEMNNSGHDLFEGDLAFKYEYKMVVRNKILFFNSDKSFEDYSYHNYY